MREWIRTLFFYYFYYINSWGGTRQSFRLYFLILFMDLAGKSGKWGVDKICDGGRRWVHAKETLIKCRQ